MQSEVLDWTQRIPVNTLEAEKGLFVETRLSSYRFYVSKCIATPSTLCHIPNVVVSPLAVIRGGNARVSHCDDEEKKVEMLDYCLISLASCTFIYKPLAHPWLVNAS